MEQIILIAHLIVALAIIGLIMLQQGKGADMGASFGAGGAQTLFGSDGSGNMLTRATSLLVVLFFASSFSLALLANQKSAPVNELDLEIPAAVQAVAEEEFPVLEDEVPVLEETVPLATGPAAEEELPVLEDDVPVLEETVPLATGPAEDDLPDLD
ncbi:MAG: preprotein translocase subunit SecG [Gammaproteobacteria bacterium]|nr:MAG: preprotein translocase subunit SecG [Gammaproteobacteria bacterium]RLA56272.1 MAG: preprotein translocase subunit SecG [Gammaproteobacteria bacterium]HDY82906.1 preprotein translocase subunit SecG [Halieaceae bacterium]